MNFNTNQKIVLASASPRRKQLLESCGLFFSIIAPHIEENPRPHELAQDYVLRNAQEKGLAGNAMSCADALILSADTIVVTCNGAILEKPSHANHAREMLMTLSANTHTVYTAYAFTYEGKNLLTRRIDTKVTFRKLDSEELDSYIASGEPFDKAGSYGIQGAAMGFVEHIEGSYTNVMGLPLSHVLLDLKLILSSLSPGNK